MNRRIFELSTFMELIENKIITIIKVEAHTKGCANAQGTDNITPNKFLESIQYLNKAELFRNSIDFYYEFSGKNGVHIEAAMKNPFLDTYFYVDCEIQDGATFDDIDKRLIGYSF